MDTLAEIGVVLCMANGFYHVFLADRHDYARRTYGAALVILAVVCWPK